MLFIYLQVLQKIMNQSQKKQASWKKKSAKYATEAKEHDKKWCNMQPEGMESKNKNKDN